jgi:hypothetical protein
MALLLSVGVMPVGIQQKITAGSQFNGAASTSVQSVQNGMTKFATDTKGGLFNFEQNEPIVVQQILANLGTSIAYQVSIVSLDSAGVVIAGESLLLASGTAATVSLTPKIMLGVGQAIQLTTTGATVTMVGAAWANTYRGFVG